MDRGAAVSVVDLAEEPWRLRSVRPRIHYVRADVAAWDGSMNGAGPCEIIFHLAAFSMLSAAQRSPELAYRQNVMATATVLDVARRCGTRRFIFTSAGGLYTNVPKYLPIDERHPIDPAQGVYVTTKRIGELLCEEFHRCYGLSVLFVRLFNTYGPRQATEFLIPALMKEALETGTITVRSEHVKRDFTFVTDMVDALLKGAESDYCGGPVNLGTGLEHGLGEVAGKLAALLGARVVCLSQEAFGPGRQMCDRRLAQRVLGWRPSVGLEEGLERTVQAFREQLVLSR